MRRARAIWLRLVVALFVMLGASAAHAEEAREAQARSYFAIGQGHFNLGEYAAAIEAFQAGYRQKPLPLFLFNIAQAARKSGRLELAQDYYTQYLDREPARAAPQRTEARAQLGKVRHELAAAARERSRVAPPSKLGASEDEVAPPPRSVAPPVVAVVPAAPAPAALDFAATAPAASLTRAPEPRPVWKRGWFWGTLGAVVVAGAGAGIGAWLALQSRAPAKPSLGSVPF
jgi:tetratricopeptide (TPR) repeat protein